MSTVSDARRLYGKPAGEVRAFARTGVAGYPALTAWRTADGGLIVHGAANGGHAWDTATRLGLTPLATCGGFVTATYRVTVR